MAAALEAGVTRLFRMGGAHAIAALGVEHGPDYGPEHGPADGPNGASAGDSEAAETASSGGVSPTNGEVA